MRKPCNTKRGRKLFRLWPLLLTSLACLLTPFFFTSCEDDGPAYVSEYSTKIRSTKTLSSAPYYGFYINFTIYDDNSCLLYTALMVEENSMTGSKFYKNYTIEFEMGGKKFVLRDKETGAIVMNGERTKTEMSGDDAFLVDWTDDLFSDWKEYAYDLGWEKPAVFEFDPFLLDDIIE